MPCSSTHSSNNNSRCKTSRISVSHILPREPKAQTQTQSGASSRSRAAKRAHGAEAGEGGEGPGRREGGGAAGRRGACQGATGSGSAPLQPPPAVPEGGSTPARLGSEHGTALSLSQLKMRSSDPDLGGCAPPLRCETKFKFRSGPPIPGPTANPLAPWPAW
eukprot:1960087-Rhodomonas_salina.2